MFFPTAPWPGLLYVMTVVGTVVLLGLTLALSANEATQLYAGVPFAVWGLCAYYSVRGFRLEGDVLYIKRLFQETRIPLQGLTHAEHRPQALVDARRSFGNGGLFAFTGQFSNVTLGPFRMYATDPAQAVTLFLPGQTIVITPANPQTFLQAVRHLEPVAVID